MRFALILGALLALSSCASAADPVPVPVPEPVVGAVDPMIEALTAELNKVRAARGLPPVVTDYALCVTCQESAVRVSRLGRLIHANENVLACGQSSAAEVIQDWLRSPGHAAYLLSANTTVGWGVAPGVYQGRSTNYWAGTFSTRTTTTTQTTQTVQTVQSGGCAGGNCAAPSRTRIVERHRLIFRNR